MPEYYLSICAIFRNESSYLSEWIDFHLKQGVQHFFLYDNNSNDGPRDILASYIDRGVVTLRFMGIPKEDGSQARAYQDCIEQDGQRSFWIAFIDIDEFMFAVDSSLPHLLTQYERFGALFVHWQIFGSSGHKTRPIGSLLTNFTKRAPTQWMRNREGKSIVQPQLVANLSRRTQKRLPHRFELSQGFYTVTEDKERIPEHPSWSARVQATVKQLLGRRAAMLGTRLPFLFNPYGSIKAAPHRVKVSRIRIHHYIVRSKEEYSQKMSRMSSKPDKYNRHFFSYHDRNEVEDTILSSWNSSS